MAQEIWTRDAGSVKNVIEIWTRDGGTVKQVVEAYVRDGGVIKRFYNSFCGFLGTMTRGEDSLFITHHLTAFLFGWDGGTDWYGLSNFGSVSQTTFTDGGGTLRTMTSCYWSSLGSMFFFLSGTSIPDTDVTFKTLKLNTTTFTRSARTTYNANKNGGTAWLWNQASNPTVSGVQDFEVVC